MRELHVCRPAQAGGHPPRPPQGRGPLLWAGLAESPRLLSGPLTSGSLARVRTFGVLLPVVHTVASTLAAVRGGSQTVHSKSLLNQVLGKRSLGESWSVGPSSRLLGGLRGWRGQLLPQFRPSKLRHRGPSWPPCPHTPHSSCRLANRPGCGREGPAGCRGPQPDPTSLTRRRWPTLQEQWVPLTGSGWSSAKAGPHGETRTWPVLGADLSPPQRAHSACSSLRTCEHLLAGISSTLSYS